MSSMRKGFYEHSAHLSALLDSNPNEAVRQAREMDLNVGTSERINLMGLRAAILVDGGALTNRKDAIEEGITLLRELHSQFPTANVTYNLANGLASATAFAPGEDWLRHQELTRVRRGEARRCFWKVAQDVGADSALRTQAWTNLANQFSSSNRLGEAQDGWLAALSIDPTNGVAAHSAARNLLWLYERGGCSELTLVEAAMLAKIAERHKERVVQFAGVQAAEQVARLAGMFEDSPIRRPHDDPFIRWVENERLTLAPVVELVDPTMGKLDWLVLPGILEREHGAGGMPPPVFAMFNLLKSDFILARDLVWRAIDDNIWPSTGRFADTLDYAKYGPESSALILAHRMALDLLDKIAVAANHYFEIGLPPDKVYFGKLWRGAPDKATGVRPINERVEQAISWGASALYGLVELAEDYGSREGILRSQKELRNAATHRFVVLHDFGDPKRSRHAPELEHLDWESFLQDALNSLRVARSAIQTFALAISQHEEGAAQRREGIVGELFVPDHDRVRDAK